MNTFINNKNYVGKMRNNKIFLLTIFLMTILLFSIIITASGINDQGTVKKGNTINLTQSCNDATYITLSSIQYPDRHTEYIGENMTSLGSGTYQYSFNDTEEIGRYDINGISDGCTETFAFYFEVTPSGSSDISSGAGLTYIASLIVIVLISVFFFIMSTRVNSPTFKISFIVISSIILIMAVFYSMVAVQQNLGGFENIISGYSTFFTVLKIMASVSVLALLVVALLISIRFYKFKRGLID